MWKGCGKIVIFPGFIKFNQIVWFSLLDALENVAPWCSSIVLNPHIYKQIVQIHRGGKSEMCVLHIVLYAKK